MNAARRNFSRAVDRWQGVGPYYAMFPSAFSDYVVKKYTRPGEAVLDPFAGRGSTVFSAAINKRKGVGIEINPVGWVYTKAKTSPGNEQNVIERLLFLSDASREFTKDANLLPPFFHSCFHHAVLPFLLAARAYLDWKHDVTDWTLMALLLIYLHGKRESSLSNQMRQTKAMSPEYSIKWWKARGMQPPKLNPYEFMKKRIRWRYEKGVPILDDVIILLGDSANILADISQKDLIRNRYTLLFTSPPYNGVTDYFYDQWLRLWLMGMEDKPYVNRGSNKGRFINKAKYENMLFSVFVGARSLLDKNAIIYVRTDTRNFTQDVTRQVLKDVFSDKVLRSYKKPHKNSTQTNLFGNGDPKLGEIDLVMYPK